MNELPAPSLTELLSPEGLEHLSLYANHLISGTLTGYHSAPYQGFSVEYAEHRPYVAGESLRFVDWKLYAKTDKLMVRTTRAETNLQCTFLVDRSASMRMGNKDVFSVLATATLVQLLGKQRDAVGLEWIGEGTQRAWPCKTSAAHRHEIIQALRDYLGETPKINGGKTALSDALHALAEKSPRRSMIVVFTDFWDVEHPEEQNWENLKRALEHARSRHHWVLLFRVWSPEESLLQWDKRTNPPWIELLDPETGKTIKIQPSAVQKEYSLAMRERQDALHHLQQPPSVQIFPLDSMDSVAHALLPFLLAHQKLK